MKFICNFNIFLYFTPKKPAVPGWLPPMKAKEILFHQRINTLTH